MYKKLFVITILVLLAGFSASRVLASEGQIEMRSTTGEDYRCWASSIYMQDNRYNISMSCRELLYPLEERIQVYMVWATPLEGEAPVKLGSLDFGKEPYRIGQPFSNLFITTEANAKVKSPQGRVVMQGAVQPITFLDRPTTATPTPEEDQQDEDQENGGILEEADQPEEELTTRDKLILGLKRAGIVAFFALIALVGLIFVVTRSRG